MSKQNTLASFFTPVLSVAADDDSEIEGHLPISKKRRARQISVDSESDSDSVNLSSDNDTSLSRKTSINLKSTSHKDNGEKSTISNKKKKPHHYPWKESNLRKYKWLRYDVQSGIAHYSHAKCTM
jgi:hypothetical protein